MNTKNEGRDRIYLLGQLLRRSGLRSEERGLSRMIRPTDPGLLANLITTHRLSLSLISLLKQLKIFYVAYHPVLSSFRKQ